MTKLPEYDRVVLSPHGTAVKGDFYFAPLGLRGQVKASENRFARVGEEVFIPWTSIILATKKGA